MEIVERERTHVVGLRVVAPFTELSSVIPAAWATLLDRADEVTGRTSGAFLELSVDLGDGRYEEIVGAQVEAGTTPPPGMTAVVVPAARWLHEVHHGGDHAIATTFGRMLDWAAAHDHRPDGTKLDVGYGTDGPHELHVRLATP